MTGRLDPRSQRNLFVCSSQLYSKWHLQIDSSDTEWQFKRSCIDIIAANIPTGIRANLLLCWKKRRERAIKFRPSGRDTMQVAFCKNPYDRAFMQSRWKEMTKDQFWHHLLGMPECMGNALFGIKSEAGAESDDISAVGQDLFELLCSSNGNLHLAGPLAAGAVQGEWDWPKLVQRRLPRVSQDGSVSGSAYWLINGASCCETCLLVNYQGTLQLCMRIW